MDFQWRVLYPVVLSEGFIRCLWGDLVLDSYSLALIVVMINRSHRKLTLFHSCVFYGHPVSSNTKLQ